MNRKPQYQWRELVASALATVLVVPAVAAMLIPLADQTFGFEAFLRYTAALVFQSLVLTLLLRALRRRLGAEPGTFANVLTLLRLAIACMLAALVLAGAHDRRQRFVVVIWVLVVLAATLLDWLDGPIARREGPTRFGAVLDIESDSWLTLWSAAAAVILGGLPVICLAPPIVRYIQPLLDLHRGKLPSGGGPWWSRATGVLQMVLLLAAFAPFEGAARDTILGIFAWPVSLAQLATMLALLVLRAR